MSSQLTIPKSPFKSRYEAIGWFFGKPLEDFNHLLPVKSPTVEETKPSTSFASDMDKILPTDLDVICNWMFECDRTRTSRAFPEANSVVWQVTDNLIKFWKDNNSSVQLRYVFEFVIPSRK